jgi:hypothetical protein
MERIRSKGDMMNYRQLWWLGIFFFLIGNAFSIISVMIFNNVYLALSGLISFVIIGFVFMEKGRISLKEREIRKREG